MLGRLVIQHHPVDVGILQQPSEFLFRLCNDALEMVFDVCQTICPPQTLPTHESAVWPFFYVVPIIDLESIYQSFRRGRGLDGQF